MKCTDHYFFQCFTHEQIKKINKEIKKNQFEKEDPVKAANVNKTGNFCHIPCFALLELIHPWLEECQKINRNFFGYDIDWLFHLEELNYNVYEKNDEYDWHVDATHPETKLDLKLTCLLNLSEEPYEGGELCLINHNSPLEFTPGMGVLFTSLIAHKVTPVTKGKRITLTYWAQGQSWR